MVSSEETPLTHCPLICGTLVMSTYVSHLKLEGKLEDSKLEDLFLVARAF